ncbi:hypothetical protein KFL_001140130 [Klebsormidium nitens]|uniref:F-box domain-containing protein n=1 Tax=Klebsormidium nitens TaxID=105231 RepID=A0A1Y1HV75_KLENI|nr:hypothetical protein KFL_001140130 [Klebsormidium nitens]|eukprot:GAQ82525.1 hypothetical protein KFL_001140130 [Klebsormidium nitens]
MAEAGTVPTPIGELPEAIAISIAGLLSLRDISSLAQTCASWHAACSSDDLWRSLYSKRWPDSPLLSPASNGSPLISAHQHASSPLENYGVGFSGSNAKAVQTNESDLGAHSWRARFKTRINQVAADEKALAALLDNFPTFGGRTSRSIEINAYQDALGILRRSRWSTEDVLERLLSPKKSVFLNVVGLHHCLQVPKRNVLALQFWLEKQAVASRTICIRVWSMGGWAVQGFRRRDEFLVLPDVSLSSILMSYVTENVEEVPLDDKERTGSRALKVLKRGLMHEVRRVQLSADFESSAWVAREQHSQR